VANIYFVMHLPIRYHDQHIGDICFELQGKWKWHKLYQLLLSNSLLPETIEIEDFEMVLKNVGCRSNINWMVMLNHIVMFRLLCNFFYFAIFVLSYLVILSCYCVLFL